MVEEVHIRHCVELLRVSLMCVADRTIEKKNEMGGVTGFGTEHKCADYDGLVRTIEKWHRENGDDMAKESGHAHHNHHDASH